MKAINTFKKIFASLTLLALMLTLSIVSIPQKAEATENSDLSKIGEVEPLLKELQEMFTPAKVKKHGDLITVSFKNKKTGKRYTYTYTKVSEPKAKYSLYSVSPKYAWTSSGWVLNRKETKELIEEGHRYSLLYSLLTVISPVTIVGVVTEQNWSFYASQYYSRGNCIKINYSLTVSEVKRKSKGCY